MKVISSPKPVLIEASKLSLNDEIMQYKPRDKNGKRLKNLLIKIITQGIDDFCVMNFDPSFTENERGIHFVKGENPAVNKSYNWWDAIAKSYCPERNSRLGCRSQYAAFLGIFIKKLMERGCTAKKAWQAVTKDSTNLQYYWTEPERMYDGFLEYTGSHQIYGFCDLTNTNKIVKEDEDETEGGYYHMGAFFGAYYHYTTLADMVHKGYWLLDDVYGGSVGWIVFDPE